MTKIDVNEALRLQPGYVPELSQTQTGMQGITTNQPEPINSVSELPQDLDENN